MFMRIVNTGSTHGNCYVLKSNSGEMLLLDCGCRYKDILKAIDYRTSANHHRRINERRSREKTVSGWFVYCNTVLFAAYYKR